MSRLTIRLTLTLFITLCLLPIILTSNTHSSTSPHAVTAASKTTTTGSKTNRPSTSYGNENRDLEEDEEEDEADEPVRQTRKNVAHDDDESAGDVAHTIKLRIFQSFGSEPFQPRGDVTLNYNPTKSRSASGKAITFSPDQKVNTKSLREFLKRDSQSSLYRVKFVPEGQTEAAGLIASVPICSLIASHFHESFIFHADPYGQVLSVTYRTPITDCLSINEQQSILASDSQLLSSKGKISFGRPGEKAKTHIRPGMDASAQAQAQAVGSETPPPTAAPQTQEKNADGTPIPPPQTFWQKYWIYIVPLGIFMILQAVIAPPEEGAPPAGGRK